MLVFLHPEPDLRHSHLFPQQSVSTALFMLTETESIITASLLLTRSCPAAPKISQIDFLNRAFGHENDLGRNMWEQRSCSWRRRFPPSDSP